MQVDRVLAHVRDVDGLAVLVGQVRREHAALAGDDAQRPGIVFRAVIQQDLTAQTNAKHGLVPADFAENGVRHAKPTQMFHGRSGRAHTGKNDPLAAGDDVMVRRMEGWMNFLGIYKKSNIKRC